MRDAEDAADLAFTKISRFAGVLSDVRRSRGLSIVAGQPIYDRAARALTNAGSTRGDMVSIHRLIEALGKQLGIDVTAFGDGDEKPPAGLTSDEVSSATS